MLHLNGSHRPPAYYEWWYFHFLADDGTAINMVLHETDIFGLQDEPYVSMTVLLPGQAPRYVRRPLALSLFRRDRPVLQVGDSLFWETNTAIQFNVLYDNSVRFAGQITQRGPPLIIEDGLLYVDEVSGRSSHWVVPVPYGRFVALLELEGRQQRLEGVGYHDHQWDSLPIQGFVSDWIWGHFVDAAGAFVYFQIRTQRGELIDRAGVVGRNGIFAGPRLEETYLGHFASALEPAVQSWPVCLEMAHCDGLEKLSIGIRGTMRKRDAERLSGRQVSYCRWHGQASLARQDLVQTLSGVTEYLRMRAAG